MARIALWLTAVSALVTNIAIGAWAGAYDLSSRTSVLILGSALVTLLACIALGIGVGRTGQQERAMRLPAARTGALVLIGISTVGALIFASISGGDRGAASALPIVSVPITAQAASAGAVDEGAPHTHPAAATVDDAALGAEGAPHSHGTEVPVTTEQLTAATSFVQQVKAATAQYQDIRVGMAAGYIQLTQDLPGIAAHFVNLKYLSDDVEMDPTKPEFLLYTQRLDGRWRLVGAMFYALSSHGETAPSFFGPLDVWHRHENLCFSGGSVRVAANQADCRDGLFTAETNWQLHVWTADGASGVFAHDYAPISPGKFPGASRPAAQDLVARP